MASGYRPFGRMDTYAQRKEIRRSDMMPGRCRREILKAIDGRFVFTLFPGGWFGKRFYEACQPGYGLLVRGACGKLKHGNTQLIFVCISCFVVEDGLTPGMFRQHLIEFISDHLGRANGPSVIDDHSSSCRSDPEPILSNSMCGKYAMARLAKAR